MSIMLALSAALAYGSADFVGGLASRRTSPLSAAFGAQLSGLAILVVAIPLVGGGRPTPADLIIGGIAGIFGGIGIVVLFKALAEGPMSLVAPTTALSASMVPILVGIGLGDRPGPLALLGIAVSVLAVVLITREGPTPSIAGSGNRRVLLTALAGGAIFGLFFVFLHQTGDDAGLWPLLAARFVSVPLLAILVTRRGGSLGWSGPGAAGAMLISGALDMAANIFYLLALRSGMLVVVAAITGLYPASTVVLAQSHLAERLRRPQVLGLGIAACAAVLIAVGPS